MRRTPVYSSVGDLAEVGYDEASGTLETLFMSGGLYHYFNVPAQVHAELMDSKSPDIYLDKRIKDKYEYRILR